jgi:hypothetical protein
MTDLISLMSRLVDSAGNILVPGVDDMVQAAGMEERWVFSVFFLCVLSSLLYFFLAVFFLGEGVDMPCALSFGGCRCVFDSARYYERDGWG